MSDIMLDIETLGHITNSMIAQVSLVKFNRDGTIHESLSVNINTEQQRNLGLEYTESTMTWWQNTNPDLLKKLLTENVLDIKDALSKIIKFISKDDIIWCHATFDIPILANLFNKANTMIPWGYKNIRDIRTLIDLSNIDLSTYDWDTNKTHNALNDCIFQIKYCTDAFNKLYRIEKVK